MCRTQKSDEQVNTHWDIEILHWFKKTVSDRYRQILRIFGIGWVSVLKKWVFFRTEPALLEMAAFVVARRRNHRKQSVVEDFFFSHIWIYLECQKNTLSESEHMLMIICSALGRLHWLICKLDLASVFFNLRIVSKSPAEMSTPIHRRCFGIVLLH